MRFRPSARALLGLVVAVQVLALLAFAVPNEVTLRTGKEVILQTLPVDPRDLFRGDYVVLRYEISRVSVSWNPAPGDTVYVSLVPAGEVWEARDVSREPPVDGSPFIRGRVAGSFGRDPFSLPREVEVEYGIEAFFIPEGTGEAIERAAGQLRVRVAVDGWGHAIIKSLIVDGLE